MSTEPKWASEPWKAYPQVGEPGHCSLAQVFGHGGKAIATFEPGEHATAHAHLIAAAPELYDRLEASTKTLILERDVFYECHSLADGTVPDDDDQAQLENLDAEIAANQAALAKARGGA